MTEPHFATPKKRKTPPKNAQVYHYGFNGKEKDDEMFGDGSDADFGDRFVDTRVGRWWSIDPTFILQPGQSTYKSFLNNPILYKDPDGRTEFETVTINDERTGKSTSVTRAVSDEVFFSHTKQVFDAFGMLVDQTVWTDKIHHTTITIDKKGNVTTTQTDEKGEERAVLSGPLRNFKKYANLVVNSNSWDKELEGKGENQKGGYVFTSKDEGHGQSPTKTKSLSDSEQRDIGDLISTLGTLGKGEASIIGKLSWGSETADKIGEISQIVQDVKDALKEVRSSSKVNRSEGHNDSTYCSTCKSMLSNSDTAHHTGLNTQKKSE